MESSSSFEAGFLLGILIGEGHFGGDGRQPHITIKAHVRHEPLLRYLMTICEGGKLYGPYHHGDRHYYQLMYRGKALRDQLVPKLDLLDWQRVDPHSHARYTTMKEHYHRYLTSQSD